MKDEEKRGSSVFKDGDHQDISSFRFGHASSNFTDVHGKRGELVTRRR